jgi:hypothetical protein
MVENYEIIPGKGVGNILLGMTSDEIEKVLGAPDDKEIFEYDDGETSCTYYYFDLDIDLTFESDDDDRLSYISVENEKFSLNNLIRIGQSKEEVMKHAKTLNFCEPGQDDLNTEDTPDQSLLSYEEQNIYFWFTENKLDEIQLGPFWKDDDTPIWPV